MGIQISSFTSVGSKVKAKLALCPHARGAGAPNWHLVFEVGSDHYVQGVGNEAKLEVGPLSDVVPVHLHRQRVVGSHPGARQVVVVSRAPPPNMGAAHEEGIGQPRDRRAANPSEAEHIQTLVEVGSRTGINGPSPEVREWAAITADNQYDPPRLVSVYLQRDGWVCAPLVADPGSQRLGEPQPLPAFPLGFGIGLDPSDDLRIETHAGGEEEEPAVCTSDVDPSGFGRFQMSREERSGLDRINW